MSLEEEFSQAKNGQIYAAYRMGIPTSTIALQLKIKPSEVTAAVKQYAKANLVPLFAMSRAEFAAIQLDKCAHLRSKLNAGVNKGDPKHIALALQILNQENKILGLDVVGGGQQGVNDNNLFPVEVPTIEVSELEGATDADLAAMNFSDLSDEEVAKLYLKHLAK